MDEPSISEEEREQLEQIRRELLSVEQGRLLRLEREVRDPRKLADRLASALPRALKRSIEKDKQLAWALRPTVQQAIRDTIRTNREEFADTLYPVMAPSIAKAIKSAIAEMVQRMNQALAVGLSPQSVKWRIEAMRTGRPFAEIALLRTLVYRVEQVLLVHKDSGVLLEHIYRPGVEAKDPASVSALLTALEAFSKEAFKARGGLERVEAANLAVRIETGSRVMIAAVVRGTPPESLGNTLSQALERVQLELADQLDAFRGDVTPFERARPALAMCLEAETRAPSRPYAKWIGIGVASLATLLVVLLGLGHHRNVRQFERGEAALRSEPGLAVLTTDDSRGQRTIRGLADPRARSPEEALRASGVDPKRFELQFAPYPSMDPKFVEQRVRNLLSPPRSVSLTFAEGKVIAQGWAAQAWVDEAKTRMGPWSDFLEFSTDRLHTLEEVQKAREAAAALSNAFVRFPTDISEISTESPPWARMQAAVERFFSAAEDAGLEANVEIIGEADPPGTLRRNKELATERAEHVRDALIDRGTPAARVTATRSDRLSRRGARAVGSLSHPVEVGG